MDYAISTQQGKCYKTQMIMMIEVCWNVTHVDWWAVSIVWRHHSVSICRVQKSTKSGKRSEQSSTSRIDPKVKSWLTLWKMIT